MLHLSAGQWGQLDQVNRAVNAYPGKSDLALYGQPDFWQRIGQMGAGDCEDFALEKRFRLMALGWNPEELKLAVVTTPQGEGHCVLTVDTQDGTMVLNNLAKDLESADDLAGLGYKWIMRQDGKEGGFLWVTTGLPIA